jgi:hypothetical protein
MLAEMTINIDAYDEILDAAELVAKKYGLSLSTFKVPDRPEKNEVVKKRNIGPLSRADGSIHMIAIDGDLAGLHDIYGAARMVQAFSTPL